MKKGDSEQSQPGSGLWTGPWAGKAFLLAPAPLPFLPSHPDSPDLHTHFPISVVRVQPNAPKAGMVLTRWGPRWEKGCWSTCAGWDICDGSPFPPLPISVLSASGLIAD